MIPDLMFALKGCPLEMKKLVTHFLLGASYFMIILLLMSLVFLFCDILGGFVSPLQSFTQLLHRFSAYSGIHACLWIPKYRLTGSQGF